MFDDEKERTGRWGRAMTMTPSLGRALALLLCALAGTAAAAPNPYATVPADRAAQLAPGDGVDRVFGGEPVPDGRYPFQVARRRASDLDDTAQSQYKAQFCGGTLVAARWVLTAAHCMRDGDRALGPADFVVLAGSTDLEAGRRLTVKSIVINDQYDDNSMDHDAALLELDSPLDLPPVALDLSGDPTVAATVLGWGMDEQGNYPRMLLGSQIEVVANTACNVGIKAIYATALRAGVADLAGQYRIKPADAARIGDEMAENIQNPLTDTMLCAGLETGKRDACYGDSGGALIADRNGKPVQLGIVSWGEGPATAEIKCGHQDVYGVYARVASFKDWLQFHLAGS
jgi:secreted trypsin-like serine protease